MPRRLHLSLVLWIACLAGPFSASGQPTGEPRDESVRILRTAWVEGGQALDDVRNPQAVVPNPVYRSWTSWGVGTRIILRTDEIDAQGRVRSLERRILTLEAVSGTSVRISQRRVGPGGVLQDATTEEHSAQITRDALLLPRRPASMLYWQRLDAIIAFDTPPPPGTQQDARRQRRNRPPPRDPAEPLPAQFDVTILEMAYVDESVVEDGRPLPDDAVVLWRSFLNVHLPGAQPILEQWRGRLDENGQPADLQLVLRWRVERVLRPNQPNPAPEQLAEGLPLDQ